MQNEEGSTAEKIVLQRDQRVFATLRLKLTDVRSSTLQLKARSAAGQRSIAQLMRSSIRLTGNCTICHLVKYARSTSPVWDRPDWKATSMVTSSQKDAGQYSMDRPTTAVAQNSEHGGQVRILTYWPMSDSV